MENDQFVKPARVPVSPDTHTRLKVLSAKMRKPMQEICEEVMVDWLDKAEKAKQEAA